MINTCQNESTVKVERYLYLYIEFQNLDLNLKVRLVNTIMMDITSVVL